MRAVGVRFPALLAAAASLLAAAHAAAPIGADARPAKPPVGAILIKGAWSSASDSATPLPEGGGVVNNVYSNGYFGLAYQLPANWSERYTGPPPSDSGYYVLAQIESGASSDGASRGSVLIVAQDMFFTPVPASNALELINYSKDHLGSDYKVEQPPTKTSIANRPFVRFDYLSPVAGLHWHVLATQIRCHTIQFVFTGRDRRQMQGLIREMNTLQLPTEAGRTSGRGGGDVPVCIKDYASAENVIEREEPVFSEPRFNPVPVRIVIDKEGRVKHIHFLSAFADQARSITDALLRWRFKPCVFDGHRVEVETGILF